MKKIISILLTATLTMSLMLCIPVSAATNETATVLINKQINFTCDGTEFIPMETDGSIVYPITYKDRTYIPARFIAERIGLEVTWDENTQTVGFNNSNNFKNDTTAKHGDRTPYNDNALINKNINFNFNGEKFVPMEADGSIVYPITYKDRTYIPVRFIAEKAGVLVDWDETTKTVILNTNSKPSIPSSPDTGNTSTENTITNSFNNGFSIYSANFDNVGLVDLNNPYNFSEIIRIPGLLELTGNKFEEVFKNSTDPIMSMDRKGVDDITTQNKIYVNTNTLNVNPIVSYDIIGNTEEYKNALKNYFSKNNMIKEFTINSKEGFEIYTKGVKVALIFNASENVTTFLIMGITPYSSFTKLVNYK